MANSLVDSPDPIIETTYPLDLCLCENCGLVQIDKCTGYNSIFTDEYVYYSSDSPSNLSHAKKYCDMMMATLKPEKVLEIGSNDGYMLQYFQEAGCQVLGYDPSGAADMAISKGIPTIKGMFGFENIKLGQFFETFDLICGINVLNHQADINDFVEGLKHSLAPKGIITFEFPSLHRMMERGEYDTIYHEHLNYYSLRVISRIFLKHGLSVFHAEEIEKHGVSLRIYAQHYSDEEGPVYSGSKQYNELMDYEKSNPIKKLCDSFFRNVIKSRNELRRVISRTAVEPSIVAYGAAAKASTLFNFCGFDRHDILFVADRSPHKINKYMPGSHIKILPEEAINEFKPEFVLITAWNIADEIMEQLKYIRNWGGRFIIPIPALRIL